MTYSELLYRLYQKTTEKRRRPKSVPTEYPCIHIAGSNGKGTVAWKIAETLRCNGYRTGLFTSPHISSFRERIRIDGALIPEDEIVKRLKDRIDDDSNFFAITTNIALSYFSDQKVDFAVIETGLGGEFDATSAVQPILTIITSLSLEHTEILGDTLEDIARAKAGILKKGIPLILGPSVPKDLIEPYAAKLECPIFQALPDGNENTATAIEAMKRLPQSLSFDNQGLSSSPPCRMETIPHPDKTIILDAAHNPAALSHLFEEIHQEYPGRPVKCLLALSNKKPVSDCLKIVGQFTKNPAFFECPHYRLHPTALLKKEAGKLGLQSTVCTNIDQLIEKEPKEEVLLACGSFFMMKEIRKQLGINEIKDPDTLREKKS